MRPSGNSVPSTHSRAPESGPAGVTVGVAPLASMTTAVALAPPKWRIRPGSNITAVVPKPWRSAGSTPARVRPVSPASM